MYRQGDVLIEVAEIPGGLAPKSIAERGAVLAAGEATGHAHIATGVDIELYEDATGTLWLKCPHGSNVTHEEHGQIALPVGTYKITRQREWSDDDEPRQVAD